MADCSASGTAIDRVVQSAVASALSQGNGAAATSSSAAATAATRALGDFFGGTAATASGPSAMIGGGAAIGGTSMGQIMPLAPMDAIGGGASAMQHRQRLMGATDGAASRLDDAWAASSTNNAQHAPMHHGMMPQQQHHQVVPMQQANSPHHMMMMQQQQHQQMMMMQQMHMQQHQMAAMVQFQQQQQQQKHHQQQQMKMREAQRQKEDTKSEAENTSAEYETTVDDDVATVSEEEQLQNEGLTEGASVERLAQAWREAEAEYAEEFDEDYDDFDVSNMGGMYDEGYREAVGTDATATDTDVGADAAEPLYEFSEASRAYGCHQTQTTDISPQSLTYPENLYERGLQQFDEGNIPEAILCFESALRNVDPDHADAWRMLGKCHAENDEDQRAIACWRRGLERDPYSTETLLALGVAYVNELDHERAVASLRGWVANHPQYAGMVEGKDAEAEEEDPYGNADDDGEFARGAAGRMRASTVAEMRDVERLLLRALEHDRTADAAADVYEALGVVYNVSRDYDAAVDAFRRALEVRPDDYQLRNKLGATLANGNRSDEALPEYNAALRLKPRYARGWLNMAISHGNLHNYPEAARCYLQTLSLNPNARHVWSYLRIALTCDERWDLLPAAAAMDLAAFREHFDFVQY